MRVWFLIYCYYLSALITAPGISASPSEENMRYFNVMILGPTQSPYEGKQLVDNVSICDLV